ncbi:hypothetical protein [Entomomonas asaccharolytica]|uniref:Uncharacterized protein n=1 Tax=Entomomonas asaccharolytica TaxID=2785331 RepID=A0A974NFI2_9GAMM|nr:hypothetical protein [Entomomonas asaccharolytica]QQP85527.1 hypothetical protein JHT90_14325 [Entomomonas asaccharolytica]
MKVIYDENTGVYKTARITGPEHNFLGLKFTELDETLRLIDLEERKVNSLFDVYKLQKSVTLGLIEANNKFSEDIKVSEIYYVSSDTENYDAYSILTFKIIEHLVSKK